MDLSQETILPIALAVGGAIAGIYKGFKRVSGRTKRTGTTLGDSSRSPGQSNLKCNEHATDIEVLKSELREIQKQCDEIFTRLRNAESTVGEMKGYLKALRDTLGDILARLRNK